MNPHVLILGAGFGGLELATLLSEKCRDEVDVTLIDKSDAFVFGYSKLDLMFGKETLDAVRLPYKNIGIPGVRFLQEEITQIEPDRRRVTTTRSEYEADFLVVALGADYDFAATPGLVEGGNEFYSVDGALKLRELLQGISKNSELAHGRAIVGVCDAPFKCPPAPSEAALLLHDYLVEKDIRDQWEISLVMPFRIPVPPSPDTSQALLTAFSERGIEFVPNHRIRSLDAGRRLVVFDDHSTLPYDLFLGVPVHRAPDVVLESGMAVNGYVPTSPETLATVYPGVYAIGDVTTVGVPKAGVFAEGAARTAAASLIATLKGDDPPPPYDGRGSCYIEFGNGLVGRVDVDFLSGPRPTGSFQEPSNSLVREKRHFGSSRRARWFGSR